MDSERTSGSKASFGLRMTIKKAATQKRRRCFRLFKLLGACSTSEKANARLSIEATLSRIRNNMLRPTAKGI